MIIHGKVDIVCQSCGAKWKGQCPWCKSPLRIQFKKNGVFCKPGTSGSEMHFHCSSRWCSREAKDLVCPSCQGPMKVELKLKEGENPEWILTIVP